MKAKTINEVQNFERGLDPKEAMDIGDKYAQIAKIAEVTAKLVDRPTGRFYCLYIWESDTNENNYYTDPQKLLEDYTSIALETVKDAQEANYEVRKDLAIYIIKGPGRFYSEREMEGHNGVQLLFSISFNNGKIYYN